jgi:hypothetical protein
MAFGIGLDVSFKYLLGWKGMQGETEEGDTAKTCMIDDTTDKECAKQITVEWQIKKKLNSLT